MKDIQIQLQMAMELNVFGDDGLRHMNRLKNDYSILFRELRKRKHANKRRHILHKFNILGIKVFNVFIDYELLLLLCVLIMHKLYIYIIINTK